MRPDFNRIRFRVGDEDTLLNISRVPALPVFSERVVSFLSDLSLSLLSDGAIREYKDIMGFAYWIRKASILRNKENISRADRKMGRGVTFHIAPSNIPIQFALSMVHALLAGNSCVIRISDRDFPQVEILCGRIRGLLRDKHKGLAGYICVIGYGHDDDITAWLSSICDVRIIWGGDMTVKNIRKIPIPPRSTELVFADRYSFAIIDSDELMKADIRKVADRFWNDTFFVDQNACSSPRLVAWIGKRTEPARDKFWEALLHRVKSEYDITAITAVNKLSALTRLSMSEIAVGGGVKLLTNDNYICRISVDKPTPKLMAYKEGGGYFFECLCEKVEDLIPLMDDKACQTVALYGVPAGVVKRVVFDRGLKGVDRIVALGETSDPGLDWDGYTIVDSLSRFVEVEA